MGKSVRKYTKGKGMKWKKGESSSSNPSTNTHRATAKGSFFQYRLGQERDTKNPFLDKVSEGQSDQMDTSDRTVSGMTTDTFKSNISHWTQCSISSFSRLQSIWSSNSVLHREMLAILAAITEIIKDKNGKETETEYFAALMVTLDSVESVESRTAVLSLLSLLIKRVPATVLRKQCSLIFKPLMKILSDNVSTENNALMRSVLKCLTAVLRVQELSVWLEPSTEMIYRSVLSLLNHHKPKVRRQCQSSICSLLKGSDVMTTPRAPSVHPMALITAVHCVRLIEDARASKDTSVTLHVLGLLKDVLSDFPPGALKQTVEAIFRCILLADPLCITTGLKALNGLFLARPSVNRLDFDVNSQLINALYDFQPTTGDTQMVLPWLETLKQAHLNLFRLDEQAVLHLPRLSATAMKLLLSDRPEIRLAAAQVLKDMVTGCLKIMAADSAVYSKYLPQFQRIFLNMEEGLGYQYHSVWNLVIQSLALFYEHVGHHRSNYMVESLVKLALLRDSLQFPFKSDLDFALGRAVRKIGAPRVLKAIPHKIVAEEMPMDLSRSWIIPVLRDNVQDTELDFFRTEFLTLAVRLRSKCASLQKLREQEQVAEKGAEERSCEVLQAQIWSLLPGFCIRPTDLVDNLRYIAQVLGMNLDERSDLHLDTMAALRNLAAKHRETAADDAVVAHYAKNYIPRLLQIYTTEKSDTANVRLAALETVKVYSKAAPPELIQELLATVLKKLTDPESSTFLQHSCVDLTAALLPYVPESSLDYVLEFCQKSWSSADHTLQKKGYRCLEEMFTSEHPSAKSFVDSRLPAIKTALLESGPLTKAAGRGYRLRCLQEVVKRVGLSDMQFLQDVFPEIVMSTKEVAEKSRRVAFDLIKEIGTIFLVNPSRSEQENIAAYFELLLSGFAGSPEGIATSLLALSHAVHEFHDKISKQFIDMVMENANILLASNVREVVQNLFGFIKVMLTCFQDVQLGFYVAKIIHTISAMESNLKRHFRVKIRELFTTLIRKFGYSLIVGMVPEEDQKLLNNIRKVEDRKKKKKKEKREIVEEDRKSKKGSISGQSRAETVHDILDELASSDEEAEPVAPEKKGKKSKVYIAEGEDDEIVDFTSPKASQNIAASKPEKKSKRSNSDFEMSADGKIIIPDDEEGERGDDAKSLSSHMSGLSVRSKKKGARDAEEDGDAEPEFGYKAGGSGIHRSLKDGKGKARKAFTGAEYRAKKAGGDVKLKGRPDPYAYIPLNMKSINKRKKAKLAGQFKGIVKGAQKGANKGSKLRNRSRPADL